MGDKKKVAQTALAITRWVGSPGSIVIHTVVFAGSFLAVYFGWLNFDRMLLVLTTIVSLEAIYLAIFIQMTINYQGAAIEEVQEDVEEIQEDVEEITEDVGELQEDVEEITEEEDAEEIEEEKRKTEQRETLESIEDNLQKLVADIEHLKTTRKQTDAKPLF